MLSWNNLKLRKKSKSSWKVTLNKVDSLKRAFGKLQFSIGTGWKHFKPLLYIYKPEAISLKDRKGLLIRFSCNIFCTSGFAESFFLRLTGSAASFFCTSGSAERFFCSSGSNERFVLFIRIYWKIFWFIRVCWKFFWFIRVYWKIFVLQGLLKVFLFIRVYWKFVFHRVCC